MIRSAAWLVLEAQFGLNYDYIECYGSLCSICESDGVNRNSPNDRSVTSFNLLEYF